MPITLQKKRSSTNETKPISTEEEQKTHFLSKFLIRIPAALLLLLVIFLWSSSTTFITGSIVHVCVTSRKLNSHLYCLSAGDQTFDSEIPNPETTIQKHYTSPISNVVINPLSTGSKSIKEDTSLVKNVKAPSIVTIQLPSANESNTKSAVEPKHHTKEAKDPIPKNKISGVKTPASIIRLPVDGDDKSKNVTTTPSSIAIREKAETKTKREEEIEVARKDVEDYTSLISDVVINPLSSVSKSIKEDTSLVKNVKAPSIVTIQLPSANESYTKSPVEPKHHTKEANDPFPKNKISGVKTPASIIRLPVDGDDKSKNVTTTPSSIAIREKTETKTKREEEIAVARKDVEEQMEILRSHNKPKSVNYSHPEACDGRRIYMYDLPPKFNKELLGYCSDMMGWLDFCKFLSNNAFGEKVPQLGNGWYNTHQYSLEPIFHARVLKHPCRVHDPEEAKLFYVPYYGGFDILRWHFKENTSVELKDKLSYELIEWLNQQKTWKRNFGLDHLFVLGKITWDFRRVESVGWGTKFLDLDELQNPMKLLIERQPWQINDVGVPHPSFFHPRSDNEIVAWQKKLMQTQRKNLVSFVGAPRPRDRESIRSILIEQCTSASDKCGFFDCSERRCTRTEAVVENLMESEFCLQPPGDSPTRKSVFDSLVAGCIPVLFDPFTAYYQYPWHLPANRSEYSVFVDQQAVRRREVNVIDRLAAVPANRRAEMRRRIVYKVLPGLVYADPEGKLERFEDAFTIAMNAVFQKMSKLP